MGVPGMMRLLRNNKWCTNVRLSGCKLVLDFTDECYWFVKKFLLGGQESMDLFGMSMIKYEQLFRQFFERLKLANITPIIVYNGARLDEKTYGPLISKTKHLKRSAEIRLHQLNCRKRSSIRVIPRLACNVLKQLVGEYQFEVHQSTFEVYPLLARLATENSCPVLTSHSDFILANVQRGFLLFEELDISQKSNKLDREIVSMKLYSHQLMLKQMRIPPQCSRALYCLNVLLRPDFSGKYFNLLNEMFSIPPNLLFRQDKTEFARPHTPNRQPCAKRLEYILSHWPRDLTDADSVRSKFQQLARSDPESMRDFDGLFRSFSDDNDSDNMSALVSKQFGRIVGLQEALTKRESTASFLMDVLMGQTNIDRLCIEDLATFRSTYSLADPVKLAIISREGSRQRTELQSLSIFDRQYSCMQLRALQPTSGEADNDFEAPDQMLYGIFLFPSQIGTPTNLRNFIRGSRKSPNQLMKIALAFKGEEEDQISACERIIVLLRLVVYSYLIGFRDDYQLPVVRSEPKSPSQSAESAAKSLSNMQVSSSKSLRDTLSSRYKSILPIYLDAVYNSVMYEYYKMELFKDRLEEAKLLRDDVEGGFYSKVRLAFLEIGNKVDKPADVTNDHYIEIKHLNEMLIASLGAYMELKSLYDLPGAKLKVGTYDDCFLIYKICNYLLRKPKTDLLTIEKTDRLYSLISDYLMLSE